MDPDQLAEVDKVLAELAPDPDEVEPMEGEQSPPDEGEADEAKRRP